MLTRQTGDYEYICLKVAYLMIAYSKKILQLTLLATLLFITYSCQKDFADDNFTAHFGGEIINPKNNYVLFLKDDEIVDTLFLDVDNRFFKTFDSLVPGLYSFKHEPEYQYIYFDKNDSLMVRVNTKDFDESVVFCGRGDEKNNFMMELYLKQFNERVKMFDLFEKDPKTFLKHIDSAYKKKEKFYNHKKQQINWNNDFDMYAKSALNFNYYTFKEIYPLAHQMRTGKNLINELPKDYYIHRDKIDYNNPQLTHFSPFVRYLTHMMSNVSFYKTSQNSGVGNALEINIHKLNIADTLFKVSAVKDKVLKNIAISYLLEDQKSENNYIFFNRLNDLVKDKSNIEEVNKTADAIQLLSAGNALPEVTLIDLNGKEISSHSVIRGKTVLFFWTENIPTHMNAAHKKAIEFFKTNPNYNFIGINIDEDHTKWLNAVQKNNHGTVNEFRAKNVDDLKDKWVITKLQRTIVTDNDGVIKNAFVNLFDVRFQEELK
ncbi:MAG: TlpA family protein disulfide reductase [Flavobacterium sp.]